MSKNPPSHADGLMTKIVSLCKRRGFVFQSSEIYGGLKSAYDYGPLGVELKRNIAAQWWKDMVHDRDDVYGLDASIMMHRKVWETSGHAAGFSDPLVDCLNCKERFRADRAPRAEPGLKTTYHQGGKPSGQKLSGVVESRGYVCPNCGAPTLSGERQFNLMFRTVYGPIDPLQGVIEKLADQALPRTEIRRLLEEAISEQSVFLRPETAQAMFVQFLNVQQAMSAKIPFGIAQIGKSFRNEIITEHFTFRSCEFEQMEMEYFVEPGTQKSYMDYWKNERLKWYQRYANNGAAFRLRAHADDELAHYSDQCFDVEYEFPWGWGELEGIASRTDYDLSKHQAATGVKLSYFDQQKNDPATSKPGWRYTPYVIEPAAGLTRIVLCLLIDAYREEAGTDAEGGEKTRVYLALHPRFAPIKAAVLPLLKKDGHPEKAESIAAALRKQGLLVRCDDAQSIGKRYAKHDEIGTPFCITVDGQTMSDDTVTLRYRDTAKQERKTIDQAIAEVNTVVNQS